MAVIVSGNIQATGNLNTDGKFSNNGNANITLNNCRLQHKIGIISDIVTTGKILIQMERNSR